MALSTELISATASVPLGYLGYQPLCTLLDALLDGSMPSSELVSYFTTVTGLLFGFGLSNTCYFLCVRCAGAAGAAARGRLGRRRRCGWCRNARADALTRACLRS